MYNSIQIAKLFDPFYPTRVSNAVVLQLDKWWENAFGIARENERLNVCYGLIHEQIYSITKASHYCSAHVCEDKYSYEPNTL